MWEDILEFNEANDVNDELLGFFVSDLVSFSEWDAVTVRLLFVSSYFNIFVLEDLLLFAEYP